MQKIFVLISLKLFWLLNFLLLEQLVSGDYFRQLRRTSGPYTLGVPTSKGSQFMVIKGNNVLNYCESSILVLGCTNFATAHVGEIVALASSKDDSFVASGGLDYQLLVYYFGNRTLKCSFRHDNQVNVLKFDPSDEDILYSGSFDQRVIRWNISSCEKIVERTLLAPIVSMDVRQDGQQLSLAEKSNTINNFYILDTTLSTL